VRFFYNCHPTFDVNEVKALRIARRVWQRALFCGVLLRKNLLLWGSFTIATLHWMSGNDVRTRHIARLFRKRALLCVRGFFAKQPNCVGLLHIFLDTRTLCCGFFLQRSLILWGFVRYRHRQLGSLFIANSPHTLQHTATHCNTLTATRHANFMGLLFTIHDSI